MFSKGKGKGKPKSGDLDHGCATCGRAQRPCVQLQQALDSDEVDLSSSSIHGTRGSPQPTQRVLI
jgi:hypothetical protein